YGKPLPSTFTVRTGRKEGGVHKYFQGTTKDGNIVGGQVKSAGGYVVGPGSVHPSGATYTIIADCPLAALPDRVMYRARQTEQHTNHGDVELVPQGQRHSHLTSVAAKLRNSEMG